jgi:glutathione S-transferase
MSRMHLVIGNKNYSSWSLRPWIAMTMAGIPFNETVVPLDTPGTKARIGEFSKSGRVPVLHHGRLAIWESLAIMEYLAEAFPEKHFWPKAVASRTMARCVANEMHAGFSALRNACPMNLRRPRKKVHLSEATLADVSRIESIWRECQQRYAKGGKFLFGKFCIADAMFAPVVTRFDTYDIPVADDSRAYMQNVMSTDGFKSWRDAALKETWIVPSDEVG